MSTLTLAQQIAALCPNAVPNVDYWLQDDGNGPYIKWWTYAGAPQPTAAQLAAAQPPAPTPGQLLSPSDYQMARGHEELVALLIAKGVIARTDLSAAALANVNARRALRGEAAL